jgi:hypothetical protein
MLEHFKVLNERKVLDFALYLDLALLVALALLSPSDSVQSAPVAVSAVDSSSVSISSPPACAYGLHASPYSSLGSVQY